MKRALAFVMMLFLGAGLALAQTGGDKSTLNPQPLPPGRHPVTTETASSASGKKATKTKKGHKGGKKSKKGSASTTTTTTPK